MGICRLYVSMWEGERDSQKHKRTHLCEGNHWLNLTCEILQTRNWDRFAPKKILIHPKWDVSRVANRLGPLQSVPKFFLRMCSSPGQAPHFLVGAPNPQLSHLHGDISFVTRTRCFLLLCCLLIPAQISVTFTCLSGGGYGVQIQEHA